MAVLESYIERKLCDWAKKHGWLIRKLSWVGRPGAPDRFFAKRARIVLMELKAPGKKPTANQAKEIARLREAGVEVHVIDSIEEGIRVLSGGRNHEDLV